jgi:hypothetical protein
MQETMQYLNQDFETVKNKLHIQVEKVTKNIMDDKFEKYEKVWKDFN